MAEALLSAGVRNPVPDLIGVHEKVALEAARRVIARLRSSTPSARFESAMPPDR